MQSAVQSCTFVTGRIKKHRKAATFPSHAINIDVQQNQEKLNELKFWENSRKNYHCRGVDHYQGGEMGEDPRTLRARRLRSLSPCLPHISSDSFCSSASWSLRAGQRSLNSEVDIDMAVSLNSEVESRHWTLRFDSPGPACGFTCYKRRPCETHISQRSPRIHWSFKNKSLNILLLLVESSC